MAARTNLRQQDQTRSAIQTTQLVKRLQDFALGEEGVEIDAGRLKAIEILLRKSLPDLSAVTMTGDPDNPVVVEKIVRQIVDPAGVSNAG
jgi:hypothetical protein